VSGESDSYRFAQENYDEFITSTDPDSWYSDLRSRGRFLVTHDRHIGTNRDIAQTILHDRFGSCEKDTDGTDHFRAVYATEERERVVFELVEGARLTGAGPANKSIRIETEVEADGLRFDYRREVETNRYGDYGVTVPYSGEYELAGETFSVDNEDASTGAFLSSYRSHWTFDGNESDTIADPIGGTTTTIDGAKRVDGIHGAALRYTGEEATVIREDAATGIANGSFSVSFWLRGNPGAGDDPTIIRRQNAYRFWTNSDTSEVGFRIGDTDGNGARVFGIDTAEFDQWTLITAVFDRDADELRLYQNTSLVSTREASQIGPVRDSGPLSFGERREANYGPVAIDSVRFYSAAISKERLEELYASTDRSS
jgi:dolichyl-diphosphooligosaccharide--protein glycosyltransferase